MISHTPPPLHLLSVRFKDAWTFASALDQAECWNELAEAALHHLDIDMGRSPAIYTVCSDGPQLCVSRVHIVSGERNCLSCL